MFVELCKRRSRVKSTSGGWLDYWRLRCLQQGTLSHTGRALLTWPCDHLAMWPILTSWCSYFNSFQQWTLSHTGLFCDHVTNFSVWFALTLMRLAAENILTVWPYDQSMWLFCSCPTQPACFAHLDLCICQLCLITNPKQEIWKKHNDLHPFSHTKK